MNTALNISHEAAVTAVIAQQEKQPYARVAMWPNDRRREGTRDDGRPYNDPHMNVTIRVNAVKLSSAIAEALARGELEVEIKGGAWTNDDLSDNRPAISGQLTITRAEIEAAKAAKAADTAEQTAAIAETVTA